MPHREEDASVNPEDLRYTEEHEWARADGARITVGITDYAQDALGDVVYIDLPATGTRVEAGQPFGEVESTKSVSDLYAPVSGTIVERNEALEASPELVNSDPYGDGWMVVIEAADPGAVDELLDAATPALGQVSPETEEILRAGREQVVTPELVAELVGSAGDDDLVAVVALLSRLGPGAVESLHRLLEAVLPSMDFGAHDTPVAGQAP